MKKIMLVCSGLGMGNASRLVAVMEALGQRADDRRAEIDLRVVSWGAGHSFFEACLKQAGVRFDLRKIHAYPHWSALRIPLFFAIYLLNCVRIFRLVRQTRPRAIVLDSDYHFPAYLKAGCPIFYIGQATDVVARAELRDYRPRGWAERLNFFLRERLDSLFQKAISTELIVPSFGPAMQKDGKINRVPLIVREEFRSPSPEAKSGAPVMLLSGSGLESDEMLEAARKLGLKVISPVNTRPGRSLVSRAELLDNCEIVLTQGGLSSISECVARRKFVVVFPMKAHSEQILNAVEVEKLGLGLMARPQDLNENYPEFLARVRGRAPKKSVSLDCDGANAAAGIIFDRL